ncbi:MAG: ABC transporter ATP-binding protein [Anaerorhabdus sp.]
MVFSLKNVDFTIEDNKILSQVSTTFEKGKFNAIIGPNGSGKSTLIKLFAGINKKNNGEILYLSKEIERVNRKDFAKEVAFFFQFQYVPDEISVEQMVSFGRSAHKKLYEKLSKDDLEIIENAIRKCELEDLRYRDLLSLSGGERQRVYLALVLAQQPKTIILDEPTNHLDIKYQYQMLYLISDIMKEMDISVICILHDFNQVLKYSDRCIVMHEGMIYAAGKTSDVINVKTIKEVFDVDSIIHKDSNGMHIDFII